MVRTKRIFSKSALILLAYLLVLLAQACKGKNENPKKSDDSLSTLKQDSMSLDSVHEGIKKYEMERGEIQYRVTMSKGEIWEQTLRFERFGAMMALYTSGKEMEMLELEKNGFHYSLNLSDRVGTKQYVNKEDRDLQFISFLDMNEQVKKSWNYQELGEKEFLGKRCKRITLKKEKGGESAEYWVYKGVPLKKMIRFGNLPEIDIEAVSWDENPEEDQDIFDIPENIRISPIHR